MFFSDNFLGLEIMKENKKIKEIRTLYELIGIYIYNSLP